MRSIRVPSTALAFTVALSIAGCVLTTPVLLPLDKPSLAEARRALPEPLLENLRAFGNHLARLMLESYRFHSVVATADGHALLYRYDAAKPGLPPHAYLAVVLLPGHPGGATLVTGIGEGTYKIGLSGVGVGLVATDEPAQVTGNTFQLRMMKSGFVEAFNPWCAVDLANCYPLLNLFLKDPATKAAKQKELAALLLSAMPGIKYVDREPESP